VVRGSGSGNNGAGVGIGGGGDEATVVTRVSTRMSLARRWVCRGFKHTELTIGITRL
jgi:hypothetical protein